MKTRKCSGPCGRILPLDFAYFYRERLGCEGFKSRCRDCHNEQTREIAARKKDDPRERERKRRNKRDSYARMVADPERLARRRTFEREWHRKAKGYTNTKRSKHQPVVVTDGRGTSSWESVDAGPFADWLRSIRPEFDTVRAMGTALGVDDSTLAKVMNGTKTTVAFSTVDRALCAYGRPDLLNSLYPKVAA